MAWAWVQSKSASGAGIANGGTQSVTLTNTPVTGNKIIVSVAMDGSTTPTVTSVTDGNSNALIQAGTVSNSNGHDTTALYFYDVPATPSKVFTVTVAGSSSNDAALLAQEISGLAAGNTTAAALDGTTGTLTGSVSPTGSATYSSTAANEYLITVFGDFGNSANATGPLANTDTNSINTNATEDLVVSYGNSTGGSESASWTYTTTGNQWAILTVAFKLAAGGAAAPTPKPVVRTSTRNRRAGESIVLKGHPGLTPTTPKPIVRSRPAEKPGTRRRGTIIVQAGHPGLTPTTPQPIVKKTNARRAGRVTVQAGHPGLTPTTPQPIVKTRSTVRRGFTFITSAFKPGLTPTTPQPIVHQTNRRQKGFVALLRPFRGGLTPTTPQPIVHSTSTRRKGVIQVVRGFFPSVAPTLFTPQPIVKSTTKNRRPGVIQVLRQQGGLTPTTPQPIVKETTARRKGFTLVTSAYKPGLTPTTPQPIVRSRSTRPRVRPVILRGLPGLTPTTPQPIVKNPRVPQRFLRRAWQTLRQVGGLTGPPPQILFFTAQIPDHRWYAYTANPHWTTALTPPPNLALVVKPALVLDAELVGERWATGPEPERWTAAVAAPRWEAEVTACA